MKNNIGIWIDFKQAFIISLSEKECIIDNLQSNIDFREREDGESKKYGRFGNQYTTYEKNRENKRIHQIAEYIKILFSKLDSCDSIVLFGPSKMKKILKKEIKNNLQLNPKLKGVFKASKLTENQMVAWVKDFYKD